MIAHSLSSRGAFARVLTFTLYLCAKPLPSKCGSGHSPARIPVNRPHPRRFRRRFAALFSPGFTRQGG